MTLHAYHDRFITLSLCDVQVLTPTDSVYVYECCCRQCNKARLHIRAGFMLLNTSPCPILVSTLPALGLVNYEPGRGDTSGGEWRGEWRDQITATCVLDIEPERNK
jgi:hypothetical protein